MTSSIPAESTAEFCLKSSASRVKNIARASNMVEAPMPNANGKTLIFKRNCWKDLVIVASPVATVNCVPEKIVLELTRAPMFGYTYPLDCNSS